MTDRRRAASEVVRTLCGRPAPTSLGGYLMRRTAVSLAVLLTLAAGCGAPAPTATPRSEPAATKAAPSEAAKPAEKAKKLTAEQQNAVGSAENYLQTLPFSRKGLIRQLSSEAGDGYSVKDATVAVDSLDIDYKEQAARSAKNYLDTMNFSRKGLIKQLSSDAGDGYTRAQAEYGVKKAGL